MPFLPSGSSRPGAGLREALMPFTAPAFLAKLATVRPAAWPSGPQASSASTSSASTSGIDRFTAILLGGVGQGWPSQVHARGLDRIVPTRFRHKEVTKLR